MQAVKGEDGNIESYPDMLNLLILAGSWNHIGDFGESERVLVCGHNRLIPVSPQISEKVPSVRSG